MKPLTNIYKYDKVITELKKRKISKQALNYLDLKFFDACSSCEYLDWEILKYEIIPEPYWSTSTINNCFLINEINKLLSEFIEETDDKWIILIK